MKVIKYILSGLLALSFYAYAGSININTASKEQLMTLHGVGEKKADAIIKYRKMHKFGKVEELKNVPGVGESIFEKNRAGLKVRGYNRIDRAESAEQQSDKPTEKSAKKSEEKSDKKSAKKAKKSKKKSNKSKRSEKESAKESKKAKKSDKKAKKAKKSKKSKKKKKSKKNKKQR